MGYSPISNELGGYPCSGFELLPKLSGHTDVPPSHHGILERQRVSCQSPDRELREKSSVNVPVDFSPMNYEAQKTPFRQEPLTAPVRGGRQVA